MKHLNFLKRSTPVIVALIVAIGIQVPHAQLKEPEVRQVDSPLTPLSKGHHNSLSVGVMLNNFGFGIGGEYSRVIGPYTELTFKTGITGLRDVSEQNFQDFFTGQRIIPNKYKRAFGFPFLFGIERRLFAEAISDNFRFFISSAAGPAMAFTYPYVDDTEEPGEPGYGFRTSVLQNIQGRTIAVPTEGINDFFSGWSEGETEWGFSGELKFGVTLGDDFKRQTTIEFGYFFYYFNQGLQMMESRRVDSAAPNGGYDPDTGLIAETAPFFDAQKYFGTPQISVTFGGMW